MPEPKYLDIDADDDHKGITEGVHEKGDGTVGNRRAEWMPLFCGAAAGDIVRSAVTNVSESRHIQLLVLWVCSLLMLGLGFARCKKFVLRCSSTLHTMINRRHLYKNVLFDAFGRGYTCQLLGLVGGVFLRQIKIRNKTLQKMLKRPPRVNPDNSAAFPPLPLLLLKPVLPPPNLRQRKKTLNSQPPICFSFCTIFSLML